MSSRRAVVDASALVPVLLRARRGHSVRQALTGCDLSSPAHLDAEVLEAMRGLVRGGHISDAEAARALLDLEDLPLRRVPIHGLLAEAWGMRENQTGYDALYVALARVLDADLVTLDARLAGAPGLGVTVIVPAA